MTASDRVAGVEVDVAADRAIIGRFSSKEHWLLMSNGGRVAGCQCGFVADEDDNGYGDSVVDHIAEVAAAPLRAALDRVRDWIKQADPYPELNGDHFADLRAAASVSPAPTEPEWTPDCRNVATGDTVADYVRGSRAPRERRVSPAPEKPE